MLEAIILAGKGKDAREDGFETVKNKSFVKIEGKAILDFVYEALEQVKDIERIVIAGPSGMLEKMKKKYPRMEYVEETGQISSNILAGYQQLKNKKYFLVVTGDIPLLSAEAVKDFIAKCQPLKKDFYYSIIRKEVSESKYPEARRTFVKLAEGVFTGGNIFLVNGDVFEGALPKINEFILLRKSPLKMIHKLGPKILIKFFFKKLSILDLEKKFQQIIGVHGKSVISQYPEIGADIDKPEDLEVLKKYIRR